MGISGLGLGLAGIRPAVSTRPVICDRRRVKRIGAAAAVRIANLLRQRCECRSRGTIYALHATQVECIGRDKARPRFEFGVKVTPATTSRPACCGQSVLGTWSLPANPCDGQTLAGPIAQS